jgi:serine/threonine protein phosphatase 1
MTVTLGDYIDRGSDHVLDRLVRNPFPTEFVALNGNHEVLFKMFLNDSAVAEDWRRLGGLESLYSYGVPVSKLMMGANYQQAAAALEAAEHFNFLASLKILVISGGYFLCHAGVWPGIPLERQSVEDLLWIRDEFLKSTVDFGRIVVHGHTPSEQPEIFPNRIDTGAFATGRLTCVVLEGAQPRFLMTA